MGTCSRCGTETNEAFLLNTGNGLICEGCDGDADAERAIKAQITQATWTPIGLALLPSLAALFHALGFVARHSGAKAGMGMFMAMLGLIGVGIASAVLAASALVLASRPEAAHKAVQLRASALVTFALLLGTPFLVAVLSAITG